MQNNGKLFIVSTPIGNLEDITLRALNVLKNVDWIACEDTRHSKILLNHYEIDKPLISYFEATRGKAYSKSDQVLTKLANGEDVALITDAGTPGISDPGQFLIKRAIDQDIEIIPIPGPSAFTAALSISGFDGNAFFVPFLPKKKGRQTLMNFLKGLKATIIFYESPHRIQKSLEELKNYLGDRPAVICRELTKQFEEIYRGSIEEAAEYFGQKEKQRGEFVVVIGYC